MTNALVTVVIPVAHEHIGLSQRAIASVRNQTVPCELIVIVDEGRRGSAWARNRGIEKVETKYLVFLDADDWLINTFAEKTLKLAEQVSRYIYVDFVEDNGKLHATPDCAWVDEAWHPVTALVPTAWARAVDGFDEDLREGGEDSEFYLHLCSEGYCGVRLAEPLFVYTNAAGSRSKRFHQSAAQHAYHDLIRARYLSKGKTAMGCCADPATPLEDPNNPPPDMVLARPKWGLGNRQEIGAVTGKKYAPANRSMVVEIDPRDAAARPHLWDVLQRPTPPPQPVYVPKPVPMPVYDPSLYALPVERAVTKPTPPLQQLAVRALHVPPPAPPPVIPPPPAQVVPTQPNVSRVTRLAQNAIRPNDGGWTRDESTGAEYKTYTLEATALDIPEQSYPSFFVGKTKRTSDPVFVFPDTDYPSYTDVKRLVELSGFEAITISQARERGYPQQTSIILSPEQPRVEPISDRAIWWSLEYGGEYEPDLSNWQGEVWASDPAWAAAHNAKFVVMGSHPRLMDAIVPLVVNTKKYDYLTLAYKTARRQRVDMQLADLSTPKEAYPGYGLERDEQLVNAKLMLHVHQHDTVAAIAPQRIALAAAYKLPVISEQVADPGAYGRYVQFVPYANLNAQVRSHLAMLDMGYGQEQGERLHQWLCVENTFRSFVEDALK